MAHFSGLTEGQPLRGVQIGEPQLTLALSAAAVISFDLSINLLLTFG